MKIKKKLVLLLVMALITAIAVPLYGFAYTENENDYEVNWEEGEAVLYIDENIIAMFSRMRSVGANDVMIYPNGPIVDFYSHDWQPGDRMAFPDGTIHMVFPFDDGHDDCWHHSCTHEHGISEFAGVLLLADQPLVQAVTTQ